MDTRPDLPFRLADTLGRETARESVRGNKGLAHDRFLSYQAETADVGLAYASLRGFVKAMTDDSLGRISLGSFGKRLVREWFYFHRVELKICIMNMEELVLLTDSPWPSFGDIVRIAHVQPPPELQQEFAALASRARARAEGEQREAA